MLTRLIKNVYSSWTDLEIFLLAKEINILIWQRVLFEFVLPVYLGSVATSHYNLDSTDNCYVDGNKLEVPVEVIVVALRYCHAYIPEEYQLLDSNYNFFDKQNLDKKLSAESVKEFDQHILRGLFATKVQKGKNQCAYDAENYVQPPQGYKDDLRALDVQAARDACVQPYLQYLSKIYNVSPSGNWDDYNMFFSGDKIKLLSYLYSCPQDVELSVGGALDNHNQSIFGDLFKIFISNFFSDLRCSDPNFWTNVLTGVSKDKFANVDLQDFIGCVAELAERPNNLFIPYGVDNTRVPVTCSSLVTLTSFIGTYQGTGTPSR